MKFSHYYVLIFLVLGVQCTRNHYLKINDVLEKWNVATNAAFENSYLEIEIDDVPSVLKRAHSLNNVPARRKEALSELYSRLVTDNGNIYVVRSMEVMNTNEPHYMMHTITSSEEQLSAIIYNWQPSDKGKVLFRTHLDIDFELQGLDSLLGSFSIGSEPSSYLVLDGDVYIISYITPDTALVFCAYSPVEYPEGINERDFIKLVNQFERLSNSYVK